MLTIDTKIMIGDSIKTFGELAESESSFCPVLSFSTIEGICTESTGVNPRIVNSVTILCRVVLNSNETILCTADHRFLVIKKGSYIYTKAADLSRESELVGIHDNKMVKKVEEFICKATPVYSIEVEKYHNFALLAGVFVHD